MKPTKEGRSTADSTSVLVSQRLLIPLIGSKTNCHFGNYSSDDCPKTLV